MKQSKSKSCKRARTRPCCKENFREPFGLPNIPAGVPKPPIWTPEYNGRSILYAHESYWPAYHQTL